MQDRQRKRKKLEQDLRETMKKCGTFCNAEELAQDIISLERKQREEKIKNHISSLKNIMKNGKEE